MGKKNLLLARKRGPSTDTSGKGGGREASASIQEYNADI